jgi:predicted permease
MGALTQLEGLWRDVRHALRSLRRAPGHTLTIVMLLALGIGANATIFNLVNAIFIRDLPVFEPERLVILTPSGSWPTPLFEDFRRRPASFSGIFGTGSLLGTVVTTESGGEQLINVRGGIASGNYFQVLGIRAALGRVFTEDDDRINDPRPVMVISHAFWQRQFGGGPQVLGRRIYFFGSPFTIIGITPREFSGELPGRVRDFWVPLNMQPVADPQGDLRRNRGYRWLSVMGRLKPDVSFQQAQAEAEILYDRVIAEQIAQQPGAAPAQQQIRPSPIQLEPGRRGFAGFRRQFGTPFQVLAGTVAIVLLIVCANVAALLLARGTARQREIAVRQALGCGRVRLVRQLFLEGLLLAGTGGLIGLAFAPASARGLLLMQPTFTPIGLDLSPDANVLLFAIGVSLATAIGFSLTPALRASQVAIQPALKSASRGSTGPRSGIG